MDGANHVYTLNGTQIVSEAWGNYLLIYLYDESGSPIGMQYRTKSYAANVFDTFYFEKNLQGDIVAIYNASGEKIGSYIYDAWGICTVTVESTNTTLENKIVRILNPFRYRGYYYDTETGLYYLQSRYYNPAWGRFLNADGLLSTGTGLLGYNMYAYCNSNPVIQLDASGKGPISIFALIVIVSSIALSLSSCASSTTSETVDPGYFDSAEGAAIHFGQNYNPKSISENLEYSTVIYAVNVDGKEKYTYSTVNRGKYNEVYTPHAWFKKEVAMAHTHGAEVAGLESEKFSETDKENATARNLISYLFTPSNNMIYYNPNGSEGEVLAWDEKNDAT